MSDIASGILLSQRPKREGSGEHHCACCLFTISISTSIKAREEHTQLPRYSRVLFCAVLLVVVFHCGAFPPFLAAEKCSRPGRR